MKRKLNEVIPIKNNDGELANRYVEYMPWRDEFILKISKNKRVLHIGCADWPYTLEKIQNGTLLHPKILNVAKTAIGVDISKEGIEILKKNGIENVYVGDIYELPENERVLKNKYDIILLPETLEHLSFPRKALEAIRKFMEKNNPNAKLVVTVPNAADFTSVFRYLLGRKKERVHPDHYAYYSLRTIINILESAGFQPERVLIGMFDIHTWKRPIASILGPIVFKISPHLLQNVAVVAKIETNERNVWKN